MSRASPFVEHVDAINLYVVEAPWAYAEQHAEAIEASWQRELAGNPKFFNGAIYLMNEIAFEGSKFRAKFLRTDFKSYLFWRRRDFEPAGVWDGFGSAILRSADGAIILGRQAAGNVNAGLAYMPGGFIDERDIGDNGSVNIVESVVRELHEETGLDVRREDLQPGFFIAQHKVQLCLGVAIQFDLSAQMLCERITDFIAGEENPELSEVIAVTAAPCDDAPGFAPYAIPLLRSLLT